MRCKKLEMVSSAFKRQSKIRSGTCSQEKTSVETITRNLPLAVLKPDQVEKLLKGQHAPDLSVAQLLKAPSLI